VREKLLAALPDEEVMRDAVVRLSITYPQGMEAQIDESALREKAHLAFDFRTSRHPQSDVRARLGESSETESKTPEELLKMYWTLNHEDEKEQQAMLDLALQIMSVSPKNPKVNLLRLQDSFQHARHAHRLAHVMHAHDIRAMQHPIRVGSQAAF